MRSLEDHFLIAMPAMGDPNFDETVTYVCRHDPRGALGVIVNRPTDLPLAELLKQLGLDGGDVQSSSQAVFGGGPVAPEQGFVLHRSDQVFDATIRGDSGIRVTMSLDVLSSIARGTGPDPVLVTLGYAGWDAGQLEAELAANSWLTVPANPAILFDTPVEQRWTAAVGLLGVDAQQITSYAGHA
jgi:putative transcriptional regulator